MRCGNRIKIRRNILVKGMTLKFEEQPPHDFTVQLLTEKEKES